MAVTARREAGRQAVRDTADKAPLVAHVIYRLGIGGLENGLVNLINGTPKDRYRHAIICLAGFTEFAERITRDDVRVYDLEKSPGKDPGCYLRLYRLLRKIRPAVVHSRNVGTLDCQIVAAAAGVPYRVHGEHGWEATDLQGRNARYRRLRRASRHFVHHYVTVSADMQDWLENVIGIPAGRIDQIYNGIDAERFCAEPATGAGRDDRFVIGTVGRLDPIKDQATLIRAVAELHARGKPGDPEIRLLLVGDGPMRQALSTQIAEAGLEGIVTLTGATDDVPGMLRQLDVFVLPSLNEGISNTILEAMACELPVVATRVGGNPELVVDGETGMLVESGDPGSLADCLATYRQNRMLCRQHGQAGRSRARREFSPQAMIENYLGLYDRGLAETGGLRRATG